MGPRIAVLLVAVAGVVVCGSWQALRAAPAGMTRGAIEEAIEFGAAHAPEPYLLRHAGRDDNTAVVAAVYTPFLRVAFLSHAAAQRGERLEPADVPASVTEPHVFFAFRWACCDGADGALADLKPQVRMLPDPAPSVAQPTRRTRLLKILQSGVRPVWLTEGSGALRAFGANAPFDDISLVAAYPLDTLTALRTFVVYKWLVVSEDIDVDQVPPTAGAFRYGIVRPTDAARWR
jgi:hypothetical protein